MTRGFLSSGGEAGRLIAAFDWSKTSIGSIEHWPQSLRTATSILLNSPVPIVMLWGADGVMLYNDAYSLFAGGRHPRLLGSKVREGWPEVADFNDNVMKVGLAGGTLNYRDQELTLHRHGRPEQVWMNLDYSPVRDETGEPAGVICILAETTERVEVEQRTEAERERQHRMLQQMPGFAALLSGPDHRYEYVNDAYIEIAGQRDFVGRTVQEAFPDIAGQGFYELLDQVYATGQPFVARAMPISLDREDGDRFVDFVYEPIRDDAGNVTGIFVGGYDVTERKRTEDHLVVSEARYRTLFETIDEGFCVIEFIDGPHGPLSDYVHVEANFAYTANAGIPDIVGKRLREIVGDEADAWAETYRHVLVTGEPIRFERKLVATGRHLELAAFRVEPPERRQVAVLFKDVTQRKRTEERLAESEARYRMLFESIGSGFCVVEVNLDAPDRKIDYRVVEANPAFYRQTGFPAAILGQWLREAVPMLEEHWYETYARVVRTGNPERFEQSSDALGRWFDVYAFRIGAPAECRVAILFNDISARRDAEERLRELNETLESRVAERTSELEAAHEQLRQSQKMEAMGSLTGGVAHDFNNLLTPIVGTLDMLQRRGVGGEREQRLIAGAAQSAERATVLVQRLLAFARRQPLQPVAVHVAKLVRGMADLVSSTTGPKIKVVVDVPDDLPAAIADPNQLEMALLNLAVNARDAMPDGGTLLISAAPEMIRTGGSPGLPLPPGQYVRVSVADTGIGMDEATLARAVEPFFSTKGVGKGTGLGLSMVHGLAQQLGGALTITSKRGVGTTIELLLPQSEAIPEAPAAAREMEPTRSRGTALLVDDEEFVRLSTADMLGDLGYRVVEAESAEEAMRLIGNGANVDLIITDHLMPGMTGTDLARAVRDRLPYLPVLVVSGYAEVDGMAPDLPRLTKPFRKDELAASIAGLSSTKRP